MDIKSIRTLVAIADHRSFQAAAHVLEMSVSNVSLQIQALEANLGVKLFDRSSRPPRLTEIGKDFVVRSRELLVSWENLSSNVIDNPRYGALKIGAVHTSVAGGVSRALGCLRKRDPGLFLQLHTALTPQLIKQLQNQSIDCAIITEPATQIIGARYTEIAREELGVIAHHNAVGDDFREVLSSNPYLRFNKKATLAQQIDGELQRRNIRVNSTMEITTLDAIESLVKNGLGVSVVPIGKNVRTLPRGIKCLPFESPRFYRKLGLVVREDCPRLHFVNLFLEELVNAY
jgi:DNA-binding transcriptional LysR family regulator